MKGVTSIAKITFALFVITLSTIPYSAFASPKPIYSTPKTPKLSDLQSLTFRSTSITVNGKRYQLASKTPISLRFEEKTLSLSAGCNSLGGKYSIVKGYLKAQTLFSTKMGCTEKLMNQDIWLNQLFSSNPKVQVQFTAPKSRLRSASTVITIYSNLAPSLKAGKTVIKLDLYESYGYADTPLGDENSIELVKSICANLLTDKSTESQVQVIAEQNSLVFRVVSKEGEEFVGTSDYMLNRINVKILNGLVVDCTQG